MFDTPVKQALAGIHNLTEAQPEPWASGVKVSDYLRTQCGLNIHWRTIDAVLGKQRSLIARRKRQGRWEYTLLAAGRAEVTAGSDTLLVDPAAALQATLRLHDLLAKLTGSVRICDPYLDDKTLEHLQA